MNASNELDLGRIQIPKVADLVAATLRRKIITREFEPGVLLPPEGSLMASFNVARTTIRDAFRILETEGLIDVRRGGGGGGRVRAPGTSMVAGYAALLLQFEGATLADVHQARSLIETPAAGMVARSHTPDAIATLRRILDDEASAPDELALTHAEGRFHQAVVDLAGNRVLSILCGVANRLIAEQISRIQDGTRSRARAHKADAAFVEAHTAHVRLVRLIEAGDDAGAEKLWSRHLEAGTAELASRPGAARTVLDLMP